MVSSVILLVLATALAFGVAMGVHAATAKSKPKPCVLHQMTIPWPQNCIYLP
jgi:hypothetical protein